MADLISREAAIKGLLSICPDKTEPGSFDEYGVSVLCGAVDVVIKGLPAVDAAPVVHARWSKARFEKTYAGYTKASIYYVCSACGKDVDDALFNYCPSCGAKMDGEANG